jgi:hypothetical protein
MDFSILFKLLKSEVGTLTFTHVKSWKPQSGGKREKIYDITLDGDMPAGGWVVAASDFRLNTLWNILVP